MDSGRDERPYFFLSYARTPKRDPADRDDPDRWVHKLYKDLCNEILQMTEARPEEAGFMDLENKLGTEWSPELITALARCRVFVPLYSRRYFESDSCGREWFAFARRELTRKALGSQVVDAIMPALWTRLDRDKLPQVAQSVQFDHNVLGERYCTEGFYGIMKLHNYRGDYQRAVHRLAERIIAIGDESAAAGDETTVHGLSQADFDSLPSAFGPASASRTANGKLQISVLAHDTSTLPPGRAPDYYAETPSGWSPYRPDYLQPVADYAQELARKCLDCTPQVGAFEDEMASWAPNGRPVPPSLCLVDAWVSLSAKHAEQLSRLNAVSAPWVSVLVPWNRQDRGMDVAREELRAALQQQLGRKLGGVPRRCQMAARGIPTLQEFSQLLPEMTMIMMKRFRKEAAAHPPAGPVIERPRLRRADPTDSGDTR
ncbi:MAG TPA: TIR-like protein FxsC [Streptosporangiaceae bacterium]|jgi:FxsC-like protein